MSISMRFAMPVVLGVVALAACSGGEAAEGQRVEIVAGGGAGADAARAVDAKIVGTLWDLDAGADGVLRLLTADDDRVTIWRVQGDGALKKVQLGDEVESAGQVTAAKDGTTYVSSDVNLWEVDDDGAVTQVVGNGKQGFTPDGGAATGPAGEVEGVAVDDQGRVVYTEGLTRGKNLLSLIRRVEADGTVSTIAGKDADFADEDELGDALRLAADPPAGTKARDLPLPGGYYTVLASGDDGTIYVNGKESVLAIGQDGSVRAVVAGRDPKAVKTAERPFEAEGKAVDARAPLYGPSVLPNVSADAGEIALTSWVVGQRPPATFRWTGDFTKGQAAIVDAVFDDSKGSSSTPWSRVRLVGKDGAITTGAWAAWASTVSDGWLYLALNDNERGLLVGRVKVPA